MECAFSADDMKVRCAVIGIGAMGRKYAAMIDSGDIQDMILAAVCCRSDESAAWASDHLNSSVRVFRGENEMYSHPETFDAVIIATPHRQHPAMAIRALKNGKNVLCDKPAGITVHDAAAINDAAVQSGKVFALMCNQRTYEQHKFIKKILTEKEIGDLLRVTQINSRNFRTKHYHRSGIWRSSWNGEGGGALINQGYHLIDMWQDLFGLPDSLYANIPFGKYNDFTVDDEATLILNYRNGMTGVFFLTTGEGTNTDRLEIVGTKGRIILENNTVKVSKLSIDSKVYAEEARVNARENIEEVSETFVFGEQGHAYHIMMRNFAQAVLHGEELIAPGIESIRTLELINGAYLSAWLGKKISFPVSPEEYEKMLHIMENEERNRKDNI